MPRRLALAPAWLRWGIVAAVAGTILAVSLVPIPGGAPGRTLLGGSADAWLHALGYLALALALAYATDADGTSPAALGIVLLAALAHGVGVEVLQAVVPTRRFALADLAADGAGALAAVLAWRLVASRVAFVPRGGERSR